MLNVNVLFVSSTATVHSRDRYNNVYFVSTTSVVHTSVGNNSCFTFFIIYCQLVYWQHDKIETTL